MSDTKKQVARPRVELQKGFPDCLKGEEHSYVNGVCTVCGENMLTSMGWTRFRAMKCSNLSCSAMLSVMASACPYCKQSQKPSTIARLTNAYLFVLEPLRVYLFSVRPSGINFFEQGILVLITTLGVVIGEYTRAPDQSDLRMNSKDFVFSLVVAFAVIPALIKEKSFLDSKTPFINRIGLALQKGLAADVIVEGLGKPLN